METASVRRLLRLPGGHRSLANQEWEDWVSLIAAAKLLGRSVEDFLALADQRSFRKGFPEIRRVDGGRKVRRADLLEWAVGAGCLTSDGRVLVGYKDIAALLGVAEQTVRDWEEARKANVRQHGSADVTDLPDPYDTYWSTGPAGRQMYLLEEVVYWDEHDRPPPTGRYKKQFRPRT